MFLFGLVGLVGLVGSVGLDGWFGWMVWLVRLVLNGFAGLVDWFGIALNDKWVVRDISLNFNQSTPNFAIRQEGKNGE